MSPLRQHRAKSCGPGGLVVLAGTNYCTAPSFEIESGTPGLASGWTIAGNKTGTPVCTLVPGRNGGLAQRIQYTGVAGDVAGRTLRFQHMTPNGSIGASDIMTVSGYVKLALSGCLLTEYLEAYTDAGAYVSDCGSVAIAASADWQRFYKTHAAGGATTGKGNLLLQFSNIHEGDTLDLIVDDVLIDKSATLRAYWDGSYPDCLWSGVANASTSLRYRVQT
jgi:hypothetical protein